MFDPELGTEKSVLDSVPETEEAKDTEAEEEIVIDLGEEETEVETEVEEDPTELKARQQGHVDLETWTKQGKPPEEWVDAKTFLIKGDFMKSIHSLKRTSRDQGDVIQKQKVMIEKLAEALKNAEKQGKESTISELEAARREALENNEALRADDLQKKINEIKDSKSALDFDVEVEDTEIEDKAPEVTPEYKAWEPNNQWYVNNEELRIEADAIGRIYNLKNPDAKPAEILEHVSAEIKDKHPEVFGVQRRQTKVAPARPGSTRTKTTTETRFSDLPAEEQAMARKFKKLGAISSLDEYVKLYVQGPDRA